MRFIFLKYHKKAIYKPRDASNLSCNAFDFSFTGYGKVNNVYDSHGTRTISDFRVVEMSMNKISIENRGEKSAKFCFLQDNILLTKASLWEVKMKKTNVYI